jgi:hypothetical protein
MPLFRHYAITITSPLRHWLRHYAIDYCFHIFITILRHDFHISLIIAIATTPLRCHWLE